ncbi:MAG: phosphotransferase system, mannose/fructose/N-acetylgalactosamine-specific component [Clostridiales bacterium]|jgi:PTS system mannose-specific IIB component|nr:phosphotransferase system, mannose/fructose/N-acetylgalactosamine-specific component [Clostridiales bacterium]
MIKLLRIDERLIHGQVVVSWCNALDLTAIVVANDGAANDSVASMTLKMATPPKVKVAVQTVDSAIQLLNDPRCEKMSILVITKTPGDALRILEKVSGIPNVNVGNFGLTDNAQAGRKKVGSSFFVNEGESELFEKIIQIKPDSNYQMTAAVKAVLLRDIIKK